IDLGAPIDLSSQLDMPADYGWFMDAQRPTLTISSPRPEPAPQTIDAIRIGASDANSGLAAGSLSIRADFELLGRPADSELADLARKLGGGRWVIDLPEGMPSGLRDAHLYVEVADRQGNITRLSRRFHSTDTGLIFSDHFEG